MLVIEAVTPAPAKLQIIRCIRTAPCLWVMEPDLLPLALLLALREAQSQHKGIEKADSWWGQEEKDNKGGMGSAEGREEGRSALDREDLKGGREKLRGAA